VRGAALAFGQPARVGPGSTFTGLAIQPYSASKLGRSTEILAHQHEGETKKATWRLHDLGQSLWLDNITRDLRIGGALKRYIEELSVTGLTSNPTIFDHAIRNSTTYDEAIRRKSQAGRPAEDLFFDLAVEDLSQAAELFQLIFERTDGVDGWVSLRA
jgi:transaldolase